MSVDSTLVRADMPWLPHFVVGSTLFHCRTTTPQLIKPWNVWPASSRINSDTSLDLLRVYKVLTGVVEIFLDQSDHMVWSYCFVSENNTHLVTSQSNRVESSI